MNFSVALYREHTWFMEPSYLRHFNSLLFPNKGLPDSGAKVKKELTQFKSFSLVYKEYVEGRLGMNTCWVRFYFQSYPLNIPSQAEKNKILFYTREGREVLAAGRSWGEGAVPCPHLAAVLSLKQGAQWNPEFGDLRIEESVLLSQAGIQKWPCPWTEFPEPLRLQKSLR